MTNTPRVTVVIGTALVAAMACAWPAAAQVRPPVGQPPTRDAIGAPVATGTGVITGTIVTDDAAAKPIRRATVALSSGGLSGSQIGVTDDNGAFVFSALAPGNYTVMASRPGYVNGYYGAKRPGRGPGTPVAVLDGRAERVQIRLIRGGVITGTLRSSSGLPVAGAPIQVMERDSDSAAQIAQLAAAPAQSTDDRGMYRVYGLRPGRYLVMVRPQMAAFGPGQEVRQITSAELAWAEASASRAAGAPRQAPPAPAPGPSVAYAPTYYPATADAASAGVVTIGAGEERSGVDIMLVMVPTARVTGQLLGLDGQPVPATQVSIRAVGGSDVLSSLMLGGSSRTGADGRFASTSLVPGRYVLSARATPPRPGAPAPAAPASPQDQAMALIGQLYAGGGSGATLWAQQEVVVSGQDVSDVQLRLQPGMTVSGTIVFEGSSSAPPADPARTRLMLMNLPSNLSTINVSSMMSSMAMTNANADGTFQAAGVMPNQYRLQVMSPGMMLTPQTSSSQPGWVLKSVVLEGRDVADTPFEVKPGENVSGLLVTMTDRVSELSGVVVDGAGRPAVGFPIVVFSTDRAAWTLGSRRVQQVRPSTNGRYSVVGLPAGEYYVCAVTELSPDDVYNPAYLEQLVAGSFKIALADGEKKVQDLKLGGGQ